MQLSKWFTLASFDCVFYFPDSNWVYLRHSWQNGLPLLHSTVFLIFQIVIQSICDVVVKLAGEVKVIQTDMILKTEQGRVDKLTGTMVRAGNMDKETELQLSHKSIAQVKLNNTCSIIDVI